MRSPASPQPLRVVELARERAGRSERDSTTATIGVERRGEPGGGGDLDVNILDRSSIGSGMIVQARTLRLGAPVAGLLGDAAQLGRDLQSLHRRSPAARGVVARVQAGQAAPAASRGSAARSATLSSTKTAPYGSPASCGSTTGGRPPAHGRIVVRQNRRPRRAAHAPLRVRSATSADHGPATPRGPRQRTASPTAAPLRIATAQRLARLLLQPRAILHVAPAQTQLRADVVDDARGHSRARRPPGSTAPPPPREQPVPPGGPRPARSRSPGRGRSTGAACAKWWASSSPR